MLFRVEGVFSGVSKKENNPFYVLHVVELERENRNLRGHQVATYYCSKEVADSITPGCTYDLSSGFGSRNVISAKLVES